MSKKTYTDTTYLPKKTKSEEEYGTSKAGGSGSVKRWPFKEFSVWLGFKKKQVTVPTGQYDAGASHGPFPGVKHFTDNKT